jgi:hypothetical protein
VWGEVALQPSSCTGRRGHAETALAWHRRRNAPGAPTQAPPRPDTQRLSCPAALAAQAELLEKDEELVGGRKLLKHWLVVRMWLSGTKPKPKRGTKPKHKCDTK